MTESTLTVLALLVGSADAAVSLIVRASRKDRRFPSGVATRRFSAARTTLQRFGTQARCPGHRSVTFAGSFSDEREYGGLR